MKDFNSWLKTEVANFGLENIPTKFKPTPYDDPAANHEIEYVVKQLGKLNLGYKYPIPDFYFGEVQWGNAPGAVRVDFGPFGGLRAVIRKRVHDLYGENVWICKKVVEVKDKYLKNPDSLIAELTEFIIETDHGGLDAPSNTYEGLERLTLKLAGHLRRNTIQQILIYEGIRKVVENKDYIIHWGATGMGRQRQDQKRLDQFTVQLKYEQDLGYIKIAGNELGDVIGKHRWKYDPSQFLEFFMPSQKEDEVLDSILAHLNSY